MGGEQLFDAGSKRRSPALRVEMDGCNPEAVTIIESVDDCAIDRESETPVDRVAFSFVTHRSERSSVTAERFGKITSCQDD